MIQEVFATDQSVVAWGLFSKMLRGGFDAPVAYSLPKLLNTRSLVQRKTVDVA